LLDVLAREQCIEAGEQPESSAEDLVLAVHRLLARSSSTLVGIAFDDMCMEIDALNIPGLELPEQPSWSRRATSSTQQLSKRAAAARILGVLRSSRPK
jgi:4-alpha-glucanotransferase